MRRDLALEAVKEIVTDEIVVAVYQTLFDWMVIHPRDLNYVATGAMGQASSHGLGLALANPDKRVIVLDGDGSMLMNLGSLVTVANAAPGNFHTWCLKMVSMKSMVRIPFPGRAEWIFQVWQKPRGIKPWTLTLT